MGKSNYKQMCDRLDVLRKEYKTTQNSQLIKEIQDLDSELKAIDRAQGWRSTPCGNYIKSL